MVVVLMALMEAVPEAVTVQFQLLSMLADEK